MTKKEVRIKKQLDIPNKNKTAVSRDVYVDDRDRMEIAALSLAHDMDKLSLDLKCE